jgi:hypothetical protein
LEPAEAAHEVTMYSNACVREGVPNMAERASTLLRRRRVWSV